MDHEKLARMQNAVRIGMSIFEFAAKLRLPLQTWSSWRHTDNCYRVRNIISSSFHAIEIGLALYEIWRIGVAEETNGAHLTNFSGKGTPRRKVKKVHKSSGTDDKKLQTTLKKMNVQPIPGIEEVNMFKSDGNVIHFSAPKGKTKQLNMVTLCVGGG
jgi:hypothetical protein